REAGQEEHDDAREDPAAGCRSSASPVARGGTDELDDALEDEPGAEQQREGAERGRGPQHREDPERGDGDREQEPSPARDPVQGTGGTSQDGAGAHRPTVVAGAGDPGAPPDWRSRSSTTGPSPREGLAPARPALPARSGSPARC